MTQFVCDNIYILILLPLWIFLMIMCGRFFSVYVNKLIIHILTLLSSLSGIIFSGLLLFSTGKCNTYESSIPFIHINDFVINAGIFADKLSLTFAFVLFSVSFAVQMFSVYYLKNEKKQYRFFALLNLFNFSTAGLFFSPNLFQFYIFWELTGIASYLLIGFDYEKQEKSNAAKKVFLINRIGDTALLGAIILCAYLLYEYAPSKFLTSLPFYDLNTLTLIIGGYAQNSLMILINALFITAALVKSAQIPFYNWLIDAMEAKLPVSALLHSSTLVAAGIYLILRLMPILTINSYLPEIIAAAGLITGFVCSICACTQNHPKKVLAYSTSAQFGLMFFAAGIMNFKAAIALFCAHAFIKPVLFLSLPDEGQKWNIFDFICFAIAGISLSGLILAGLASKEMMIISSGNYTAVVVSILSFLTAFYITRLGIIIYEKHGIEKKPVSALKIFPVLFLFVINTCLYLYLRKNAEYTISYPYWSALFAIFICIILFYKHSFRKIPIVYNLGINGFYLDMLYKKVGIIPHEITSKFCNYIDRNIFSNYKLLINSAKIFVKSFYFIEKNIMNKSVEFTANSLKQISYADSKAQSGNIQKYNLYAFIIITVFTALLVFAYSAVVTSLSGGQ